MFVPPQPQTHGSVSPTKTVQNGSPSKCPRFMKVKNWETGGLYNDTLHHSSSTVCLMLTSMLYKEGLVPVYDLCAI